MERKGFKEWLRKKVVYLKRQTRIITMLLLIVTSCAFAFQMSIHSQAVMFVTNNKMALVFFVITLASFLSIFAFIGFKKFNRKNLVPLCMTSALLLLQLGLDIWYIHSFKTSIATDAVLAYVPIMQKSLNWMTVHLVFICFTIVSIPLLPVISKLLGLINVEIQEEEPEYLADGELLVDELVE